MSPLTHLLSRAALGLPYAAHAVAGPGVRAVVAGLCPEAVAAVGVAAARALPEHVRAGVQVGQPRAAARRLPRHPGLEPLWGKGESSGHVLGGDSIALKKGPKKGLKKGPKVHLIRTYA